MVDMDKVKAQIVRQVGYYFGDINLSRDKFLKEKIKECEGGWIPMEVMLKFQRLSTLASGDGPLILKALKEAGGDLIEVDEEGSRIRRNPEKTIPELTDELKAERQEATVYVKGFDKENTDTDEILEFFDSIAKNVACVDRRRWINKSENTKGFKGSCFVTFKTKEDAKVFMDSTEEIKYKDLPLIKKWQKDYIEEKRNEISEKRKKWSEAKATKAAANAKPEPAAEEITLPKGSVLVVDSLNEQTSRENIKEVLKAMYNVESEDIAFVDYERGQKTAKLRFKKENAAKEVFEKIEKSEEKFKVNEAEVEIKVLEGEEEEKFLKECVESIKNQHRSKRKKGFGGRGGKRRKLK